MTGRPYGVDSAVNSVARIFTPILFGQLYFMNPTLCFCAAGAVVSAAAALVMVRRIMVMGMGVWGAGGSVARSDSSPGGAYS